MQLVRLPGQVSWEGQAEEHVAVAETVSDKDGDQEIADWPGGNTARAVTSVLSSGASKGESIEVRDASPAVRLPWLHICQVLFLPFCPALI